MFRASLIPSLGCALAAIINDLEDGLQLSWLFWGFVASSAITVLGLLVLTILTAATSRGATLLLAVVPGATMAGVILFEPVGGILMLAAWACAAVVALRTPLPPHPSGQ